MSLDGKLWPVETKASQKFDEIKMTASRASWVGLSVFGLVVDSGCREG
jgi:hypothetical protein